MTRCLGCINPYTSLNSILVTPNAGAGSPGQFVVRIVGINPLRVRLMADIGEYLNYCNGCYGTAVVYNQQVVIGPLNGGWSEWTVESEPNCGCYVRFKNVGSGTYLTRCRGCVPSGPQDIATAHVTGYTAGACSEFVLWKPIAK